MSRVTIALLVAALGLLSGPATAVVLAHQPFFEGSDIGPDTPWQVQDPTVSTAVYATLQTVDDVDYFVFEGKRGQEILLALTIPQVEGQDDFAPTLALMGEGLPKATLPSSVVMPRGSGALEFPAAPGPAPTFFEPFSRTSYWDRQEERVTLPADGRYIVAVWHPTGELGRYTFVIGTKERLGGDPAFAAKLRNYWKPVEPGDVVAADEPHDHDHADHSHESEPRKRGGELEATWQSLLKWITGLLAQYQ